ncbi:hypothetical protein [Roseiterribacter gracilis]|uniref:Uncharacterized protein n=1 Tax=Roseiterribacter gracilis TaxID=2812848 RepID=A0A8S8XCS0_9PROT|nr:hypothetical protein TMPK1_35000 [Rhodospirillales bacterium TMPK1]
MLARIFSATVFILCFLAMLTFGASVGISLGGVLENGWAFSWLMLALFVVAMLATAATWERARR